MPDPEIPTLANGDPQATVPLSGDQTSPGNRLPSTIGRYTVLGLLGEGGMGAVYEAEQDQPRRRVALKVIKSAFASPELLRRFEQETETLGRLQHPGIAQIFEAGCAGSAFGFQPFFAMELIHGQPLVEYAAARRLGTRARIELMIQICDAVQHAHQRGIIHRDLKPGNILVNEFGQPKILDFGLARATDSDAQATRQTDMGQLLGTLAYMSPEQVLADPLALDTRSDVYALGVILYELLGGRLPYTLPRSLHEAVRTIQEADPPPLGSLDGTLRGDLETIAAKALEKDKNRRYASASGLAADLQRYLEDQPISARRASAGYQLKKFARRHRALVTGFAVAIVVLVLGIIASTWEAVRARRAESRANQQTAIAQAVNDFLRSDLLSQASAFNQNASPDPNLTVRTALDRAAARVEGRFPGQPLVEASVRETIGGAYIDLGLFPQAQSQFERALAFHREQQGESHPDTLGVMASLAAVYERNGKTAQAEDLYSRVIAAHDRARSPMDRGTLLAMNGLAVTYADEGRYADALKLQERVLPLEKQLLGENSLQTLRTMGNLAATADMLGQHDRARAVLLETMDRKRRALGETHPETLDTMTNLAEVYQEAGDYSNGEKLLNTSLAGYRRVLGNRHPATINALIALADMERITGNYAGAEKLFNEALTSSRAALGDTHPRTLEALGGLGETFRQEHRAAAAAATLSKAVELFRKTLGPEHPETLDTTTSLAEVYLEQRRFVQAEAQLRPELAAYEKTAPDAWQRYFCQTLLGAALAGENKTAEAGPLLSSGYDGMLRRQASMDPPDKPRLAEAHDRVTRFNRESGRSAQARLP